ncbi:hypothetical protein SAMN05443248_8306 [Bradyrhizobium erythrophlei]|jgi:hypothetical protein|uniref:Uncharacterized protein n=1 Tax=Bradyrhizobium erythrophlei TaxID=1437360 RepID=A0A1M5YH53_9BRAD|nr:hypothetical protein SAMN05443248_8306 [Bradyrhizobium erythrophlei]
MAGLVPAIHVFVSKREDVDARDKRGHDELMRKPHSGAFAHAVGLRLLKSRDINGLHAGRLVSLNHRLTPL